MKVVELALVERLLEGIDKTETDDPPGWWETSTGSRHGKLLLTLLRERAFDIEEKHE